LFFHCNKPVAGADSYFLPDYSTTIQIPRICFNLSSMLRTSESNLFVEAIDFVKESSEALLVSLLLEVVFCRSRSRHSDDCLHECNNNSSTRPSFFLPESPDDPGCPVCTDESIGPSDLPKLASYKGGTGRTSTTCKEYVIGGYVAF